MTAPTRPGGRTVPSRRIIAGRMSLGEVKREVREAFRLGLRIAEQRKEREYGRDYDRDNPRDEYERGFAEAMRMVDEDDAREARRPKPMDLGGLGYSEYWAVYAAVLDDLAGIADDPGTGWIPGLGDES